MIYLITASLCFITIIMGIYMLQLKMDEILDMLRRDRYRAELADRLERRKGD